MHFSHSFILNNIYLYFSEDIYNSTLESVRKSFPQYVRELEGVAEGAQVEFHKVSKFKICITKSQRGAEHFFFFLNLGIKVSF